MYCVHRPYSLGLLYYFRPQEQSGFTIVMRPSCGSRCGARQRGRTGWSQMIVEQPGCILQGGFREEEVRTGQEVAQTGEREKRTRERQGARDRRRSFLDVGALGKVNLWDRDLV